MQSKTVHRVILGSIPAGAAAVGGVAYASIPGADGQVSACYATTNGIVLGIPRSKGDLRAVDSGEACRAYEKRLTWNQAGVKGDVGPTGPPGRPVLQEPPVRRARPAP